MKKQLIDRKDVEIGRTWDLTGLYAADEDFGKDVENLEDLAGRLVHTYKGRLNDAQTINRCLDDLREVYRLYHLTSSYAHLAMAVDMTDHRAIERRSKNAIAMAKMESKISFVNSEILAQNWTVIREAMEASEENSHYLADLLRFKPFVLHPEVERVLSALSGTIDAPYNIYNRAKLADMDFGTFEAGGKEYPLSFVLFENEWEFEPDPEVRRAAFDAFSKKLREYQNTVAAVYDTQVQTEKTVADLRGYGSVIDSLLFDQKVERELYDRQIDVIFEKLAPHMRRYADLVRRVHKMDEIHFSDLKLVVDPDFEPSITVEESKGYILEGLSILGPDYTAMLERAFDERWIDFVQNKGKSTGAFCSSPYGSHPFILISWTERMREVFVLAHELGHAGHFYLAQKNQNVFDTRPSLYFIESPSTMNEMLMANHLVKSSEDKRFKRWVYSTMISRTYYHNFVTHLLEAYYQREVYRIVDDGGSLQASTLNNIMRETLEKFWGDSVYINDGAELTWMRQPHYYMGLYPYTYSAGLTIATEVSRRALEDGESAIEDWKKVLKAGGTLTPVELAKLAGVDITTEQPLLSTIEHIGNLISEIERLTLEIEEEDGR